MKTPYPYQEDAISLGLTRSALIADECGLGKTITAIEIVRRRMLEMGGAALIVVPKSTIEQWMYELEEQLSPYTPRYRIESYTPIVPNPGCVYITHYEALLSLGNHLAQFPWTTIVADEAHRIKNKDAKRTRALKRLVCARRIALTGTPIEKTPADLWSILNWLQPHFYNSYWQFCGRYVAYQELHRGKEIFRKPIGVLNPSQLADELRYIMLRRTKKEVAPDLPDKIITTIHVSMTDEQLKMYEAVAKSKDIEVPVRDDLPSLVIPNELAKINALQMIGSYVGLLGESFPEYSSRVDWLDDYLEDNPEEVIVIFTRYRGTAQMLARRYHTGLIMGGDRETSQQFLEGHNRLLVGTIAAMGEGLNLQRASTAIFFEAEWSSTKMTQAVDRIHRINITEPKQIIYLISSAIDKLILDAVEHKWSEAELVQEFLRRA